MIARSTPTFLWAAVLLAGLTACEDSTVTEISVYHLGGATLGSGRRGYELHLVRDGTRVEAVVHAGPLWSSWGGLPRFYDRVTREVTPAPADFQKVLDLFKPTAFKQPGKKDGRLMGRYQIEVSQGGRTSTVDLREDEATPEAMRMIEEAMQVAGYDAAFSARVSAEYDAY